jgi:polycystin 1L2
MVRKIIMDCFEEYSSFNQEQGSFGLSWNSITTNTSSSFLTFDTHIYNSFQYTKSSQIDSYPYAAVRNTYLGGGFVFKMKGNSLSIVNQTQTLKKLEWIDKQTAALFVEFTLFNPNINLYQSCLILFEILNTGGFVASAQFNPIDLNDLNNGGILTFKILINIIYLIFICVFMFREVREILKKKKKYFYDFYNYLDLIIIAFSWAAFTMYLYTLYASYDVYSKIGEKSTGFTDKFINLQYITSCHELFNTFLGICAAFATLRFIKLLRFNKKIIVFLAAFKKSLNELVSFGVLFLILWMSFVQAIYLILNNEALEFSSLPNTMYTCFQIILGKFNADLFYDAESMFAPFLFVAYNVCVVFVMLNVFVSILIESFNLAREDKELEQEDPELFSYLKSLLSSIICFWRNDESAENKVAYKDLLDSLPNTFDTYLQRIQVLAK